MTTSLSLLSLLISCGIGYLFVSLILEGFPLSPYRGWIEATIGIGVGLGITSILGFLWQLFIGQFYIGQAILELCLAATLIMLRIKISRRPKHNTLQTKQHDPNGLDLSALLTIIMGSEIAVGLITFCLGAILYPYGIWDAWRVWNRSARFLYAGGQYWRNVFSPYLHVPDYPMLIGASVARGWRYTGKETVLIPIMISFVFILALIGLLMSSLGYLRGRNSGLIAGIILFSSSALLVFAPMQLADIPIAFYFLATVVLLNFHEGSEDKQLRIISLLLAGFMSSLSAWTKNEGWPFIIAIFVIYFYLVPLFKEKRLEVKPSIIFMLGALPVLIFVSYFKFVLVPANYIFSRQPEDYAVVSLVSEPWRYQTIMMAYVQQITDLTPDRSTPIVLLLVLAIIFGIDRLSLKRSNFLATILLLAVMLASDFLIYLISPFDLVWHVSSSFHRLSLQLWPIVVFETTMIFSYPNSTQTSK